MYLAGLPEYYGRNFHYQTEGYLSEESAELYEHQTEILFMGTLGLMRRLCSWGERREFDWALKKFPKDFHEPCYTNYIGTRLHTLLTRSLAVVEEKSRFLSKSLLARKI